MISVRISVYLLIYFFCACAQEKKDEESQGSGDVTDNDPVAKDPDDEDTTADQPVEVSGSFLTAVGTIAADNAQAPAAAAGFRPIGIDILSAITLEKVSDPVEITEIEYVVDGVKKTTKPVKATVGSGANFHAVFEIAASVPEPIDGLVLKVSISESAEFEMNGTSVVTGPAESMGDPSGEKPQPNPNAPPPLQNVDEHQLFVSDGRYKPGMDFKNIKEANDLCNGEAGRDSELDKFWWKAVLADDRWSIDERQPLYGPVKNLDGDLLFSVDSFSAAVLGGSLQFANFGAVGARAGDLVFTGINKDGSTGLTCNSWQTSTDKGTSGSPTSEGDWLSSSDVECGQAMRLYCISNKIKRVSPEE